MGCLPLSVLDPAYAKAVLKLKVGTISDPVETSFGFHLIELIARTKDQRYATRHILRKLDPNEDEIALAKIELNQIRDQILTTQLSMETAIQQYSEDKEAPFDGGLLTTNIQEGEGLPGVLVPAESLPPDVYFAIESLQEGQISQPQFMGSQHRSGWRLLYLKQKVDAHVMNLSQDYAKIHHIVLQQKKQAALRNWIQAAKEEFAIHIVPEYQEVKKSFEAK